MGVYLGKVIQAISGDEYDGMRIKARVEELDRASSIDETPFAFPLLPKVFQVTPELGEYVFIFVGNDDRPMDGFRYYIGPIISQPQYMNVCDGYNGLALLGGNQLGSNKVSSPLKAASINPNSNGAFARSDSKDVIVSSRKNSDIILGEDDLCIRCGAKLMNNDPKDEIKFNGSASSFLHLKYNITPFQVTKYEEASDGKIIKKTPNVVSTATLVAQEVNLVTTDSLPKTSNTANILSDENLQKIIEDGHPLPYGDTLINFLKAFREAFNNHTHDWGPSTPVHDYSYDSLQTYDLNSLLSKNIRIL